MAFRRAAAVAIAGAAFSSAPVSAEVQAVDCGGHYAETCTVCPQDNGELWCNGECMWVDGKCKDPNFWTKLHAFTMYTFWLWVHAIPVICLIGLVMLAYAVVYKRKVVDDIPKEVREADQDDLSSDGKGLFDCFKMPHQMLWATFCAPVVMGKNYAVTDVMPFWPACCFIFWGMFSLFWPLYCIMAVVRTIFSSKVKRTMGVRPKFVVDFFTNLCCFPCEVGRESIEVDEALGVKIKCPFEVEKSLSAKMDMLGEAAGEAWDRSCSTRMCS